MWTQIKIQKSQWASPIQEIPPKLNFWTPGAWLSTALRLAQSFTPVPSECKAGVTCYPVRMAMFDTHLALAEMAEQSAKPWRIGLSELWRVRGFQNLVLDLNFAAWVCLYQAFKIHVFRKHVIQANTAQDFFLVRVDFFIFLTWCNRFMACYRSPFMANITS